MPYLVFFADVSIFWDGIFNYCFDRGKCILEIFHSLFSTMNLTLGNVFWKFVVVIGGFQEFDLGSFLGSIMIKGDASLLYCEEWDKEYE